MHIRDCGRKEKKEEEGRQRFQSRHCWVSGKFKKNGKNNYKQNICSPLRPYKPGPEYTDRRVREGSICLSYLHLTKNVLYEICDKLLPTKYYLCSVFPSCSIVLVWSKWKKQRKRITFEKILKLWGGGTKEKF